MAKLQRQYGQDYTAFFPHVHHAPLSIYDGPAGLKDHVQAEGLAVCSHTLIFVDHLLDQFPLYLPVFTSESGADFLAFSSLNCLVSNLALSKSVPETLADHDTLYLLRYFSVVALDLMGLALY